MSSKNLYKVLSEENLDSIINNNLDKIIVIMYSSLTCNWCKKIKPFFITFSKDNQDAMFIYINMSEYKPTTNKYTQNVTGLPLFRYYYYKQVIAEIVGCNQESLVTTFNDLTTKINNKRAELQKSITPFKCTDTLVNKANALRAIYNMAFAHDLPLPKLYDMNTDIEELQSIFKTLADVIRKHNAQIQEQQAQEQKEQQLPIYEPPPQSSPSPPSSPIVHATPIQEIKNEPTPIQELKDNNPVQEVKRSAPFIQIKTDDERTEKMKQIQKLNSIKSFIENEQLNKLQYLRNIQKNKEKQEYYDRRN